MNLYAIAMDILECLEKQLGAEADEFDDDTRLVNDYILIPGVAPFKVGFGKCSQAWVRIVTSTPASAPGRPEQDAGNCNTGLGIQLEVGIMRCWTPPAAKKEPDRNELSRAFAQVGADILSIRTAIICCTELDDDEYRLGTWRPMGPAGVDVGGYWTIDLALV